MICLLAQLNLCIHFLVFGWGMLLGWLGHACLEKQSNSCWISHEAIIELWPCSRTLLQVTDLVTGDCKRHLQHETQPSTERMEYCNRMGLSCFQGRQDEDENKGHLSTECRKKKPHIPRGNFNWTFTFSNQNSKVSNMNGKSSILSDRSE